MGNNFLHNIREVDAILHLVRCFDSPDVVRGDGGDARAASTPADDAAVIEMELLLADLATMDKAMSKQNKWDDDTREAHAKVKTGLEAGTSVRHLGLTPAETLLAVQPYNLLSAKPVLFLVSNLHGLLHALLLISYASSSISFAPCLN
jgi:ribosome-binding ATPase YchF (GTP1/OBG family)